jgi:uncharacterized membrane protein YhaH (DUF805 family)
MNPATPYAPPQAKVSDRYTEYAELKILSFRGRIGRMRFLAYTFGVYVLAFLVFGSLVALLTPGLKQAHSAGPVLGPLSGVLGLTIYVFAFMVGVRRLHDLDPSGLWYLLSLIPLVNLLLGLYLTFAPGTRGVNSFGNPPPPNSGGVAVLGLALPLVMVIGSAAAIVYPAYHNYTERAGQAQ